MRLLGIVRLPVVLICVSLSAQVVSADRDLMIDVLQQHFYKPITFDDADMSPQQIVDFLNDSGLDPWAAVNRRENTDAADPSFGLRLLAYQGNNYLLPMLGGPNEQESHVVYKVINPPSTREEWTTALADGALKLAAPYDNYRLKSSQFDQASMRINGSVLRVDSFKRAELGAEISLYSLKSAFSDVTVVDLRYNGGGRIDLAEKLLTALVGAEIPLGLIERKGETQLIGAQSGSVSNVAEGMYVLVSPVTASSAEWVARNLQVMGATVIGEPTLGKCLVQKNFPVGDRDYFLFATGVIYPAGDNARRHCTWGIQPDYFATGQSAFTDDAFDMVANVKLCLRDPNGGACNLYGGKANWLAMPSPLAEALAVPYKNSLSDNNEPATSQDQAEANQMAASDERGLPSQEQQSESGGSADVGNVEGTESVNSALASSADTEGVDVDLSNLQTSGSQSAQNAVEPVRVCVSRQWSVQVIAYDSKERAADLVNQIASLGLRAEVGEPRDGLYRVVVRAIDGVKRARDIKAALDQTFSVQSLLLSEKSDTAYQDHFRSLVKFAEVPVPWTDGRLCLPEQFQEPEARVLADRVNDTGVSVLIVE